MTDSTNVKMNKNIIASEIYSHKYSSSSLKHLMEILIAKKFKIIKKIS